MSNKDHYLLDNLFDIRIFICIVENSSFTLAAQKLGISRSAAGKSLSKLENQLNTRLLYRTTRQVSLTDEGQLFYQHSLKILNEIENAESALNKTKQYPRGKLKISMPVAFGRLHVLPILQKYLIQWPEVQAELYFSDEYCDLVKDGIDLAIRIGGNDDSRLVRRVLAPHRLLTCASPEYLRKHGTPQKIEDLNTHHLLGYSHQGMILPWRFKTNNESYEYKVRGQLSSSNTEAIKDASISGLGICHLGAFLVGKNIANGSLIPVLKEFHHPEPSICAIYPSRHYLAPKVKLFLELIQQTWQNKAIWDI
ncbi:LysR family transcriptional regulator [Acinetobacter stercoris]|uniref:HTH-type transcriptional regulator DmlR n=1 Tax=Acinetobacter stercoris TaxID=2126983 RepID=A0A2U3MVJ9_9GAMM|nr:LysR family transcriptional regulator [Acinetobacter stercoris]SPL69329.1 HTH-type transcriptional regulator DmlR [Acinetobacter stercoris]